MNTSKALFGAFLTLSATSLDLQAQSPVRAFRGSTVRAGFGVAMARIGDVDGDSISDLAVAEPGGVVNAPKQGIVRVFSSRDGSVLYQAIGSQGDYFGFSLSALGDVNNDTFPDFLAGAPQYDVGGRGYVAVLSGLTGQRLATLPGPAAGSFFGTDVRGIGDIDNDTYPDFLAGAPHDPRSGYRVGSTHVFSGLTRSPIRSHNGTALEAQSGHNVCGLGDLNDDGVPDYAIALPGVDTHGRNSGAIDIHSGFNGALIRRLLGSSPDEGFGWVISPAGDQDGDGREDLLTSTYHANGGRGYARVYGRLSANPWVQPQILWTTSGNGTGDEFGLWSRASDVNDDAIPDLMVGAPQSGSGSGYVKIFDGRSKSLLVSLVGSQHLGRFGRAVVGAGRLGPNSSPAIAVCASLETDPNTGQDVGSVTILGIDNLLRIDTDSIDVLAGGRQQLLVDAGPRRAGDLYWILGSFAGTGYTPFGGATLPLILDGYTTFLIFNANTFVTNSLGQLDSQGRAVASFSLQPNLPIAIGLRGARVYHAALFANPTSFQIYRASQPVACLFK